MPLKFVTGDPTLTHCQTLAIGHNRVGRIENTDLSNHLMQKFSVAYASYTRQCKNGKQSSGELFLWRESQPQLLFLTVRDSSVGATRLRHVQQCLLTLARDFSLHHISSLAIAPLGESDNWNDIRAMLVSYFEGRQLPVVVYESYQAGIQADETFE